MSLNNVHATVNYSENSLSGVLWDKTALEALNKITRLLAIMC